MLSLGYRTCAVRSMSTYVLSRITYCVVFLSFCYIYIIAGRCSTHNLIFGLFTFSCGEIRSIRMSVPRRELVPRTGLLHIESFPRCPFLDFFRLVHCSVGVLQGFPSSTPFTYPTRQTVRQLLQRASRLRHRSHR